MPYLHDNYLSVYNDTHPVYDVQPYGSAGGQIFFSFLFMVWILLSNVFLIFLILKDSILRAQPHNTYVFFLCLCDLSIGLFYLPLNMDLSASGRWNHGCSTLVVWTQYFLFHACACTCTVGVLMLSRLCSTCPPCRASPMSMKTRNILHGVGLGLVVSYAMITAFFATSKVLWGSGYTYPEYIGVYSEGERFTTTCGVLNGFEYIYRFVTIIQAFWAPIYVTVVLLAVGLYRVTRVDAPERLKPDTTGLPMKVLIVITLVTLLLPAQFMTFLCVHLPAPCALLLIQSEDFRCDGSVAGLSLFLQWLMLSKSGVLPLCWFVGEDYRRAAGPFLQKLQFLWRPLARIRRSK